MSSDPSVYTTRSERQVKTPVKYSPTCPTKKKNMSSQKGKMTGHYKATKPARKSYTEKVKAKLTTLNLMTGKPERNEDESDYDQDQEENPNDTSEHEEEIDEESDRPSCEE